MAKRSFRRSTRRSSFDDFPDTVRFYVQRLNSTKTAWEYFDGETWSASLDAAHLWEKATPADLVTMLHLGSVIGIKNIEVN